jgi:hypothetical protein
VTKQPATLRAQEIEVWIHIFLRRKEKLKMCIESGVKELVRKVELQEPIEIDKINIMKDNYSSNAYIIDLPLDSGPDRAWQDIF